MPSSWTRGSWEQSRERAYLQYILRVLVVRSATNRPSPLGAQEERSGFADGHDGWEVWWDLNPALFLAWWRT